MTPTEAMRIAITEAKKGAGFVSPNPLVGCVILDQAGEFVASGYHARLGDLHAEAHALRAVTNPDRLNGAHVFVTLEPCAHQGRQPSCAKTLAGLPIASVTYGLRDPNPLVSGQGAEILRVGGKRVAEFDEFKNELEDLAEIFLTNQRIKRPFVALKVASSLDGQIALASGESKWITGENARLYARDLRGQYDAVLTGLGTVLRDDPRFDFRGTRFESKRARLVILDPAGDSFAALNSLALIKGRSPADLLLVTRKGLKPPINGRHIEVELNDQGQFDLHEVLRGLRAEEIHSVFVEAGALTVSSFLRQKLVDRLYLFMAPKILGQGLGWSSGLVLPRLSGAVRLDRLTVESLGDDLLVQGRPNI